MTPSVKELVLKIDEELRELPVRTIPNERKIRREYSRLLKNENPALIFNLASELKDKCRYHVFAYELIANHKNAFKSIGETELEVLGKGMDSWWSVDVFARTLSGPAWLKGQVSDELIHKWAKSEDLWWRRAALVSTVALNMRSQGGMGDTTRTLFRSAPCWLMTRKTWWLRRCPGRCVLWLCMTLMRWVPFYLSMKTF